MSDIQSYLARHCFTEFALEQPIGLDSLRESAEQLALPMASSHAPSWFSAAAHPEAPLIVQAPELQILPAEPLEVEASSAKVADIDLVRMYAPELADVRDAARAEAARAEAARAEAAQAPEGARTTTATPVEEPVAPKAAPNERPEDSAEALRLLRELSGLDD